MPVLAPIGFRRALFYRGFDLVVAILFLLVIRPTHHYVVPWDYLWQALLVLVVGMLVVFQSAGVYRVLHTSELPAWCFRVLGAWVATLGLLFGAMYALKISDRFPRLVMGPWAISVGVALIASRWIGYAVMDRRFRSGKAAQRVLLVGDHGYCRRLARHLARHPGFGLRVVGICTDQARGDGVGDRFPALGCVADIGRLVEAHDAHRVIVSAPIQDQETIFRVFAELVKQPVIVQYAPDLSRFSLIGFHAADYAGQPVFNLTSPPLSSGQIVIKWLEDKLLGLVCLVLAAPVMLGCALLIKLTSPGPVFFVQTRHGVLGRPIRVLKFRTMRQSDSVLAADGCERTDSGRYRQACAGDPRVTWIGNILRKTSLDELPQLLNVLKGDMSLVGPRPHPIQLNEQFTESIDILMRRHYMKPGITGLAQISGARGETATAEAMRRRIAYDLEYLRSWSLWLDLKILLLTPVRGVFNRQP